MRHNTGRVRCSLTARAWGSATRLAHLFGVKTRGHGRVLAARGTMHYISVKVWLTFADFSREFGHRLDDWAIVSIFNQ